MSWLKKPTVLTFNAWLKTELGQALIETETQAIEPWIRHAFGYHTLLLGEPEWASCLREHPIKHTIWLHPDGVSLDRSLGLSPLRADWHAMPLDSDSIDMVFLAHVLEQDAGSVDILREAYRVLLPQGHLVLSTFNPWSLFGLMKPFLRHVPGSFWGGSWITQTRLKDWLALLGFTLLEVKTVFFRWPYGFSKAPIYPRMMAHSRFERLCQIVMPHFCSSLLIIAQKTIRPLTPIKPKWKLLNEKKIPVEGGLEPTINA
jgi:SAM-dependent methyltransferase